MGPGPNIRSMNRSFEHGLNIPLKTKMEMSTVGVFDVFFDPR